MSGAQTSTFPSQNILYDMATGATGLSLQSSQNELMKQQQDISGHQIEMGARLASTLLDPTVYPTTEARAAAYPGLVARARAQFPGYFTNAPDTYPGDEPTQALARMGTPSATQQEWQANIAANKAYTAATGTPATTTPAATTTGGGTTAAAPATSGTVEPDALVRAQAVRDGLIKRGLDVDTATGFAANALHESGANPNVGPGDAGASHGTFQWNADRLARYQAINGHPPDNAPLDEQLDFVVHELGTTEGAARDRIAAAQGPAGKAAAISQYYLRPKDVQAEIARRSGTATQLASQWGGAGTSTATPVIAGDSLASQGGLGGSGVVGASPKAVLAAVQADSRSGKYNGQPVVLSTGASNDPTDLASVEQQIREAQGGNAGKITVLGVGPAVEAKAPGTNAKLQALATSYGAQFVPLPADQMSPDGVHPTAQGYATLKAAVAPAQGAPGGGGQPGRYQVASNVPTAPPGAVAAPAATAQPQAQIPQPPANRAMPGAPDGPPAAVQSPPAPQQPAPAGGPAPPQLPPLNARGLTAQQQAQIDAVASTGRMTVQQRMAAEQAFVSQNIQLSQKAFSDYVQLQQLEVSRGNLTNAQADTNLKYWQANHPELAPNARVDTFAYRTLQELAPIVRSGNATQAQIDDYNNAATKYQEFKEVTDPVTKQLKSVPTRPLPPGYPEPAGVGGNAGGVRTLTEGLSPAQQEIERDPAKAKVADMQYERDSKNVGDLTTGVTTAQNDNLRTKEMLDILENGDFSTGPGSETRTRVAAWFQRWAPAGLTGWEKESPELRGPAAAQAFQKLAFQGVTTQEKESSPRGGILATQLFQRNNPGLDLLNPANKALLDMKLIQNQANIDYGRDALGHFTTQETRYGDTHKYSSLEQFNTAYINQRNPQVYAAAMGAVSGQPVEKWADGLSEAEYARALGIVERAKPGAVVNGRSGRIVVQPAGTPPIPPGMTVVR